MTRFGSQLGLDGSARDVCAPAARPDRLFTFPTTSRGQLAMEPEPERGDVAPVRVEYVDRNGRREPVVVIPDRLARAILAHKRATWTEIHGVGAGYCAPFDGALRYDVAGIVGVAADAGLVRGGPIAGWVAGESAWQDLSLPHPAGYHPDRLHGPDGLLVATPYMLSADRIGG